MEGVGRSTPHGQVQNLPGLLSYRRQQNITSLPRLVLRNRLNALTTNPCYRMNLMGHYGCVNAIEFSNKGGEYLASGGDDRRILLWNIEESLNTKYDPKSMKGEHHSNIFCLAFDNENGKIFSGGNDDQVIVHDTRRGEAVDVFLHEDAVYGVAVDPRNDNIYASACADGRVLLWDIRAPSHHEPFALANYVTAFHAVVYHPQEPRFLATANAKEGIALWDVRSPKNCLLQYGSAYTQMNAMSVRFNQHGTQLLALRRRLPAVLYDIHSSVPAVEFNHEGYYNSCTMKSCCFAGDKDEFVLSGSDDFNLYIWRVPEPKEETVQQVNEAFAVLQGHRQIVNQVRFNQRSHLVASSGVEKVIKLWSAMKLPGMSDGKESPRKMYTRQQYLNLMISSGSALSHDYSEKSKEEDPRMLAFFDSFIQREVDHSLSSDSSDDSALSPDSLYLHFVRDHTDGNSSDGDEPHRPSLLPPELGMLSNSESDLDSHLINRKTSSPKTTAKVQEEEQSVSTSSEAVSCVTGRTVEQTSGNQANDSRTGVSDAQDKKIPSQTSNGSEGSSGSRRGRHRSRSITDSSSSSDESEDFLVMRYRSRLLRRIMRQKSKKAKETGVSGRLGIEPSQLEKDRLSSLQQRIAFSRVMKERFTTVSDSDSSLSEDNQQFLAIVGQLRQRTDSARQRAASLRRHRMRALEELSSLTGDFTRSTTSTSLASRSPHRNPSINSSENLNRRTTAAAAASVSSPSASPLRVENPASTNSANSVSTRQSRAKEALSSPCKFKRKSRSAKSNSDVPSTSDAGKRQAPKKDAPGCSLDNNHSKVGADKSASSQAKESTGSKNGFKKLKAGSSGKKRHYRNANCYSRKNDSDSD